METGFWTNGFGSTTCERFQRLARLGPLVATLVVAVVATRTSSREVGNRASGWA